MERKRPMSGPAILKTLTSRIEDGRHRPGDRLIPAVLARELGVSAIPVREALCQLVGRDMLVERRHKGFFVAPMTSATLRALYSEHGRVVAQAIHQRPGSAPAPGRVRKRWPLFGAIAHSANNEALAGTQRYLAGRLALARKHEAALVSAAIDAAMLAALRDRDAPALLDISGQFHAACEQASGAIWQLMSDR